IEELVAKLSRGARSVFVFRFFNRVFAFLHTGSPGGWRVVLFEGARYCKDLRRCVPCWRVGLVQRHADCADKFLVASIILRDRMFRNREKERLFISLLPTGKHATAQPTHGHSLSIGYARMLEPGICLADWHRGCVSIRAVS